MKKYLTVFSSFFIMLCIGSVYAWSIVASELMKQYRFSASQSQIIFGTLIAVFPISMIFAGQFGARLKYNHIGYISGFLFCAGYLLAGNSNGAYIPIFMGIGILAGMGTGFGYWVALTAPVQWFPRKKGLITGIAAAGFGLGAVFMSELIELLLMSGNDITGVLRLVGLLYGLIISLVSYFIFKAPPVKTSTSRFSDIVSMIRSKTFAMLTAGIFLGTFAGLLVIGNLKLIGGTKNIPDHYLILGVSFFALANFLGRLLWGILSDKIGANTAVFLALIFQSLVIISLDLLVMTKILFILISSFIGFGFGANFVLFAKETAQLFGLENLGRIYPYVFLGYAVAGITGPISGGLLYDMSGSYFLSIVLAAAMSLIGSLLFLLKVPVYKAKES